ncbi:Zinc finger RING-type [Penicillium bovifimosum]|uniref:RING-type E3 ubiquitin transferase n=1 Tax=Penicillium bovifimosum TaxID=126998 RepID=A0A9W9GIL7_9EURO|nr:Zinc finger RING-type [Penicillium bovifimosum]KAJ5120402.1 Zinc finger RING-type [Penicillium bovifimosum]
MADDDSHPPLPTPNAALGSPTSHFYPFATSPDIIRSHEKDVYLTGTLIQQSQGIVRALRGARFAHTHSDAIKHLTELLYFTLTTAIGNRTLGEEYCDLVQLEDDTLQLPSIGRRVGYILSSILVPWALQRILPALRHKIRSKLERIIAKEKMRAAQQANLLEKPQFSTTPRPFFTKLRIQQYLLEHLDSITSLSPIYALSIATFYFTGSYYHLAKRIWRLRYVFTKKIEDNEQRIGYEVLGVLLVLQIAVQSFLHIRKMSANEDEDPSGTGESSHGGALLSSIQNPSAIPLLPASVPLYDLEEDPSAVSWIPEGQQRKCTLCLESFKDPSLTTCGHVFCWICVRDWVGEKPECPLCRQEVLLSKVLPLRG